MQTPAGYAVNDVGQLVVVDWLEVIFNPSFPFRIVHMVMAAYLTTALVVGATGAFHLRRNVKDHGGTDGMFAMAIGMIALVAPLQLVAGDLHGLNTLEHQPAKIAAMEGHFGGQGGRRRLLLFGIPDNEAGRRVHYAVEVPGLGSLILRHDVENAEIRGLERVGRATSARRGLSWSSMPSARWSAWDCS